MKWIWTMSAAALISALASSIAASEPVTVVVGQRGFWDTEVVQLGTQKGVFQKHGLEPQISYTKGGGETIQAVLSGSAEFGVAAGALGVFSAFSKGAPIRVIGAEITGSPNYWIVKADSPIKTIKDMEGKRVAISTNGSGTHTVALIAARDNNLKVEIVPTGTVPATFTALMSGQVDVGFAAPPFALDSIDKGETRLLFRDNEMGAIGKSSSRLLISAETVSDDLIGRFIDAYNETVDWMYNGDEALEAYAKLAGMSVDMARRVRDEFYSPKAVLQPSSLAGLDSIMADAVEFGFMKETLSEESLGTLLSKMPKSAR